MNSVHETMLQNSFEMERNLNETLAKNMQLCLENKSLQSKLTNSKMNSIFYSAEEFDKLNAVIVELKNDTQAKNAMILKLTKCLNTTNVQFDRLKQKSLLYLKDFAL